MNREQNESTMRFRLLKAIALVMSLILVIPGIEVVVGLAASPTAKSSAARGIESGVLGKQADAFAALEALEQSMESDKGNAPPVFMEEAGLPSGAHDIRASSDGGVIGFIMEDEAEDALSNLIEHMRCRGWRAVPLGNGLGATFVKNQGSIKWALATCTDVGGSTSVVFRCATS